MESIPNEDNLYIRVCRIHFDPSGNVRNEAFEPRVPHSRRGYDDCGNKSVDWNKYSTPDETVSRDTSGNCRQCYSLGVGGVRAIGLEVDYLPLDENKAHSTYHSLIPQIEPRESCKEKKAYEQPEEQQLDELCKLAEPVLT